MRAASAGAVAGILGLVAAGLGQPPALPPLVAPPAAAPAATKADIAVPPDPAVAALIRNLGADDYRVREKAGRDLEVVGDKALTHLRKALAETDSPEVARRLSVLVRKVEYDRLVNPRRVTMPTKNRTAKEAFDEIARQTGYRIEYQGNGPAGDAKYPVGFDNTPFWQAMDTLADLVGGNVTNNGFEDDTLAVHAFGQSARTPFVAYAGPFKVVATNVQLSRSLQLTGTDPRGVAFLRPSESVHVMFNLFSEPKNPLLGMSGQPVVVTAEDDLGQSMAPPQNQPFGGRTAYYGGGAYRSFNLSGNLFLTRGGREARALRTLKAKVEVNLLSGVVPEVTVRDPLKAKNLKQTGRTLEVEVESATGQNGSYTVSLTVRKLGGQNPNFPDYNWSNSIWQKVELIDEKGNKYRNFGPNNMNQNPGWVSMTLPFQATDRRGMPQKYGPPVRLVVNEWVQATHEVTFEFRDVPLP
ncbi:MAG TPA: hypothetical protein VH092_31265 [Urbifossiella sp.]|nr:hypothetical protein [Urbifossiella sp.]